MTKKKGASTPTGTGGGGGEGYLGSGFGQTQIDLKSPFPSMAEHRRLVAFRRLTVALGSELDLHRRIHRAIREIRHILEAERATVYLYDPACRRLMTRVHDGFRAHNIEVALGEGLVGEVASQVRPLNVKDASRYPGYDATFDSLTGFETRAALAVPMTDENGVLLGVVQVLNRRDGEHFDKEDEDLLGTLTQVLAVNVEHARLHTRTQAQVAELTRLRGQLEEKVSELELLFAATRAGAAALDARDLVRRMARLLLSDLPYPQILLVFTPAGGARAWCLAGRAGTEPDHPFEIPKPGWLERDDVTLAAGLTELGLRHLRADGAPRAVLRFPDDDHVRGALAIYGGTEPGPLPTDHRKVLVVLLAQLVRDFGRAMEMESERQEDRLLTIGRTLSSVLHDLRTPMAVINGYTDLIARSDDTEKRGGYAASIKAQVQTIERMTHDVLAFARGDVKVLAEKVYLKPFMGSLEDTCRRAFADSGVELVFEVDRKARARFDHHKMQRVLLNMVRNAVEAMSGRPGRCVVGAERAGDVLRFTVADDGVGIPSHLLASIFETFASHGKESGTGLGLAVAHRIVDAHGGRIEVESVEGAGTTFRIELPAEPKAAGGSKDAPGNGSSAKASKGAPAA